MLGRKAHPRTRSQTGALQEEARTAQQGAPQEEARKSDQRGKLKFMHILFFPSAILQSTSIKSEKGKREK
jgi:hypothetical protein